MGQSTKLRLYEGRVKELEEQCERQEKDIQALQQSLSDRESTATVDPASICNSFLQKEVDVLRSELECVQRSESQVNNPVKRV